MKQPLYAQLAQDLAEKIGDGRYPVGALLPTELELCALYGASRHTVRAAIHALQERGLVSRRKKVGTRVEAKSRPDNFRQSLASVDDLVQFGAAHQRVVREMHAVTAQGDLARELGCAEGTEWLRIASLRLDGRPGSPPIGWTDTYIDAKYAALRDVIQAAPDVLISGLIEEEFGRRIAEIQQDVQATGIPPLLAGELQADEGAPALKIRRSYFDTDLALFEVSITIHPMDRFIFSMRLTRE